MTSVLDHSQPCEDCTDPSLAQGGESRQGEFVTEGSKTFRVPWLNSDGNQSWHTSGDIIVDYNVVEAGGAWYVNPSNVRLGDGWIGGHFLESVSVPNTFVLKFGEQHVLSVTDFNYYTSSHFDQNVWVPVIEFRVDKMAGFYFKIPFIFETSRWERPVRTASEGTIIVNPFE